MSNVIVRHVIRFIVILLLQALILRRVQFGWEQFNYVSIMIYPLFILLLPMRTPRSLLILLGFVFGLSLDLFYDSPGVHASASVFSAFVRPFVLKMIEPRGGYPVNASPTRYQFGTNWFLLYSGIILFLHLLFYFSMEVFTFVYFFEIWLKTIFTFILSFMLIQIYIFLFNPKE